MSVINVLHVTKGLSLGGAEKNLVNLVKATDQNRFKCHVAYSSSGIYEDDLAALNVHLHQYSKEYKKVKSFASIGIILNLASYIRKHKIHVVHTHTFNAHVWGTLAAKLAGAKVVEHVHDPRYEPDETFSSRGMQVTSQFKQAKTFGQMADTIIVLTQANRKFILDNEIASDEKVKVFLNGIPLEEKRYESRTEILNSLNVPLDKKIVFTAMRLSHEKNARFIIDIAKQLKQHSQIVFLVAGDGPDREELDQLVKEQGLAEHVKFIGFVSDVQKLLSVSDIFILPTLRELHSLTMIEAMSMGVPTLVSQGAGCNDDFIDHQNNGFLLDPTNESQWSKTIEGLIKDENKAKTIGNKGKLHIQNLCDINKTVNNIENVYLEITSKT